MDQCETCGIGFFLPSGTCDHCNTRRITGGSITVGLTNAESDALAAMSNRLDLPQDKVMVMALRYYEAALSEVESPHKLEECPYADPHVYCNGCKVSPCPLGLD